MKSGSQAAFFGLEGFLENQMVTSSLAFEQGISGKTFIIQGLGKMGANLATFLQSAGAKCVGVKEHDCHVFDKEGFNVHDIISHKKLHGTLKGFQLAKPVDDFEIYKEDCDILILAAKQKSIVCHMAKDIKAKLIVEAAYAPITPSAYMILRGHSKIIIPDIFICGGSAVGAYLEYCLSCNRRDSGLAIAEFYKNILDQLCSNDRRVVISKNSIGKIKGSGMEPDILTHALRILYRQKTQEMIDVALKYNLGYDFKTAAFLMSIRNIFDQILCSENIKL
ncbi:hypothetical protein HHI36_016175 [Cryptolaemus montrouzieri]|uniref:Glutamate/phenylalanine/leucine/valine/L-tryptophan dehydrogenase C-terminal domain-containing protein n=1 Tax=Cryptolaemus montrouzieri TaxID=559131 RepID=A0ABD2NJC0_9CUCU